jgi:AcrR family transcriptional regulator
VAKAGQSGQRDIGAPPRRYDSRLRQERAGQTRERIVSAGSELVRELSSWDWRKVTIEAVAKRAGVHPRTVYRHFATEQDLRDAVVQRLENEAGVQIDGLRLSEVPAQVEKLFSYVSSFAGATGGPSVSSQAEVDRRRKESLIFAVSLAATEWSEADRRRVAAMVDVLWSMSTYRELVSGWGLDSAEAAQSVNWVIELVTDAIRRDLHPSDLRG